MKTNSTKKEMELLIDSNRGQYIPHLFAKIYGVEGNFQNWEEIKEDINFLKNEGSNENEDYWETWENVLNDAKLVNGYTLYHNEDLWVVPEGFEWDELD